MRAQEKLKRKLKEQKRREAIDAGNMNALYFFLFCVPHSHLGFRHLTQNENLLEQKLKFRLVLLTIGLIAPPPKRQKLDQIQSGITIGIDMAFDDLMLEKVLTGIIQFMTKIRPTDSNVLGQMN